MFSPIRFKPLTLAMAVVTLALVRVCTAQQGVRQSAYYELGIGMSPSLRGLADKTDLRLQLILRCVGTGGLMAEVTVHNIGPKDEYVPPINPADYWLSFRDEHNEEVKTFDMDVGDRVLPKLSSFPLLPNGNSLSAVYLLPHFFRSVPPT